MQFELTGVKYNHRTGLADLTIINRADDGEVGSLVTIGLDIPLEQAKAMTYDQLLKAGLEVAASKHTLIGAALRQDA